MAIDGIEAVSGFSDASYESKEPESAFVGAVQRTSEAFARGCGTSNINVNVETGVTINWGKDKGSVSGYFSGEVRDSKGNYAKGDVRHQSDGTGTATMGSGYSGKFNINKNK